MSNWEKYDDDAKLEEERIKVGLVINFKSMSVLLRRIEEEVKTIDDKYPRNEILKIWCGDMFVMFLLFVCSYNVLIVATGPLLIFYLYALVQTIKVWNRFHYSKLYMTAITLGSFIASFVATYFIHLAIWK